MSRLLDALNIAVLIVAGVLAVVMLIDVTFDPATCFGSCS